MTEPQIIDAPRSNRSTGPKTPEGKKVCALNAYRHGLTGQLNIQTTEEQQAYDNHSKITLEVLAPVGVYELNLAQRRFHSSTKTIADDHWRRAGAIEASVFAVGMQHSDDNTGAPQVDDAFAQGRTLVQAAHNLQLLTIYEQRIQRAADKNTARLETLQARRKEAAKEDMRQAKLLYQLAQAEGKPYQPEAYFTTAPEVSESVFSTPEVAQAIDRAALIADARTHRLYSPTLTRAEIAKVAHASAGEVAEASACEDPARKPAKRTTVPAKL